MFVVMNSDTQKPRFNCRFWKVLLRQDVGYYLFLDILEIFLSFLKVMRSILKAQLNFEKSLKVTKFGMKKCLFLTVAYPTYFNFYSTNFSEAHRDFSYPKASLLATAADNINC